MNIAIIGAGMAGLACATHLNMLGHVVELYDKGRGPSGRMSTRRLETPMGEASFDIGAQYFTARDAAFRAQVALWVHKGIAGPWPAAGTDAYVGTPSMSAPLKHMASSQRVQWNTPVEGLVRDHGGWRLQGDEPRVFDAVLIAVPAEQAAVLLQPVASDMAMLAKATLSQPCWTAMAAFAYPIAVEADILPKTDVIGWAARNSAKPGRVGPEAWVVQASPAWSQLHLEETPNAVARLLIEAFGAAIFDILPIPYSLPIPMVQSAHRWRFARAGNAGRGMVWDAALRLGICGDWLLGPRVECAWLSGTQLASAIGKA